MPKQKSSKQRRATVRKAPASKRTGRKNARGAGAQRKPSAREIAFPREGGPRKWLFPTLESAYTRLTEPGQIESREPAPARTDRAVRGRAAVAFRSHLQPGEGENVLHVPDQDLWLERLREYKQRKAASAAAGAARAAGIMAPAPAIPGARNWMPLGPSVVLNGQAQGMPAVGGRVGALAIAPGGQL